MKRFRLEVIVKQEFEKYGTIYVYADDSFDAEEVKHAINYERVDDLDPDNDEYHLHESVSPSSEIIEVVELDPTEELPLGVTPTLTIKEDGDEFKVIGLP